MRLVFVLALAGAMVNTGVQPGPETQLQKSFGTLSLASLDPGPGKVIFDRLPIEPEVPEPEQDVASDDRYPAGGDPMVGSMIRTHRTLLAMPVPQVPIEKVCAALASAADTYSLPVSFLARLIWQESRFRQNAESPVGAQGVAQFMPQTANAYGLENPYDPLAALPMSARFLRELHDMFGNLGLAAAAYNGGSGRVQNWLARRSKLPDETRNYVKIITGHEPEKWTVASDTVDMDAALPRRAPCEGTAGLARDAAPLAVAGTTTAWVGETIRKAEEAEIAARIAAAKAAAKVKLLARAKGSKKSHAAKAIASNAKGKTAVAAKRSTDGKGTRASLVIAVIDDRRPGKAPVKVKDSKPSKVSDASASRAKPAHSTAAKFVKSDQGKTKPGKPIKLVDARGSR